LKDWDIKIYRGVLTGYNEAFIIDEKTKMKLISEDPKSAEIIRPILRGRDIKKYGYDFADLWLINTHNGIKEKGLKPININDYVAIKKHLDQYYPQLEKRADKGDTPYNLRNCAYMEDFYKQKIVYQELTQGSSFVFDKNAEFFVSNTGYLITGTHLEYILAMLNSKFIETIFRQIYSISLGSKGLRWLSQYIEKLPIIKPETETEQHIKELLQSRKYREIDNLIYKIYDLTEKEIEFIEAQ